jgi:hypothetical protein
MGHGLRPGSEPDHKDSRTTMAGSGEATGPPVLAQAATSVRPAFAVVDAHEQLRAVPFLPGETLAVATASASFPAVARPAGRPTTTSVMETILS